MYMYHMTPHTNIFCLRDFQLILLVQTQTSTVKEATVMILSFRTDKSGQTVQTQIRLLLEEQSDQGLHCLLFHLHFFDEVPFRFGLFV